MQSKAIQTRSEEMRGPGQSVGLGSVYRWREPGRPTALWTAWVQTAYLTREALYENSGPYPLKHPD